MRPFDAVRRLSAVALIGLHYAAAAQPAGSGQPGPQHRSPVQGRWVLHDTTEGRPWRYHDPDSVRRQGYIVSVTEREWDNGRTIGGRYLPQGLTATVENIYDCGERTVQKTSERIFRNGVFFEESRVSADSRPRAVESGSSEDLLMREICPSPGWQSWICQRAGDATSAYYLRVDLDRNRIWDRPTSVMGQRLATIDFLRGYLTARVIDRRRLLAYYHQRPWQDGEAPQVEALWAAARTQAQYDRLIRRFLPGIVAGQAAEVRAGRAQGGGPDQCRIAWNAPRIR